MIDAPNLLFHFVRPTSNFAWILWQHWKNLAQLFVLRDCLRDDRGSVPPGTSLISISDWLYAGLSFRLGTNSYLSRVLNGHGCTEYSNWGCSRCATSPHQNLSVVQFEVVCWHYEALPFLLSGRYFLSLTLREVNSDHRRYKPSISLLHPLRTTLNLTWQHRERPAQAIDMPRARSSSSSQPSSLRRLKVVKEGNQNIQ